MLYFLHLCGIECVHHLKVVGYVTVLRQQPNDPSHGGLERNQFGELEFGI